MTVALGDNGKVVAKRSLKAKYKQAEKLLPAINELLVKKGCYPSCERDNIPDNAKVQKILDIQGIVVVKGPGSFTALRIGVATANALSYSINKLQACLSGSLHRSESEASRQATSNKITEQNIPVIGVIKDEYKDLNELMRDAKERLRKTKKDGIIEPEYGREPNITISRKP